MAWTIKDVDNLPKYLKEQADKSWYDLLPDDKLLEPVQIILKEHIEKYEGHIDIFPYPSDVFKALNKTSLDDLKAIIIGQDPYPNKTKTDVPQAVGLCFSVPSGCKPPRSLVNIYKELGIYNKERDGDISKWASYGVLMMNSSLTVCQGKAGSHIKAWMPWTKELFKNIWIKTSVKWLLWGGFATKKAEKSGVDLDNENVLVAGHPSPLNTKNPFVGCGHFDKVTEIPWRDL